MWKKIKRRVSIENGLCFDCEVSPHRTLSAKMAEKANGVNASTSTSQTPPTNDEPSMLLASVPPAATDDRVHKTDGVRKIGDYVPFKQSRLKGQTNPLRPPLHVETVLIGRALDQPTGYLFGVGFRVREDGYLEAEFADGVRKFDSYEKFEMEVTELVGRVDMPDADPR